MSSILDNFIFAPFGGKKTGSALRGTWTLTLKLATDFKSVVSTYSTIKANRKGDPIKKYGVYISFDSKTIVYSWFATSKRFQSSIIFYFILDTTYVYLTIYQSIIKRVHPIGFEPMTNRLEGDCSIQLSYGCLFLIHII